MASPPNGFHVVEAAILEFFLHKNDSMLFTKVGFRLYTAL